MLRDGFGRIHDDLRISVTDRCNLRCTYCMPEKPVWFPRSTVLTYEEILRVARIAVGLGVRKVRVTGGEPLVRRDVTSLVSMLARLEGIEDLSLTTNGLLLESMAPALADAGLRRVNVSLDTLDPECYERLTRRPLLDRVLRGLDRAVECGLAPVKINTVLLAGVNEHEAEELARRGRDRGWEIRFIEFMPLENGETWQPARVVRGEDVRRRIHARWPIEAVPGEDPSAPATRFRYLDGRGSVGFIDSVSRPFCGSCSRIRLTSDGKLRSCLYSDDEIDVRDAMRSGAPDEGIAERITNVVAGKKRGGALDILEGDAGIPLVRTMHQIGG